MADKHILFTFGRAPFGTIYSSEGLRAVVGMTAGIDEHTVDVVYVGDGVYYTLKGVERKDTARYLGTLSKLGVKLQAERESLEARGLGPQDLAEDVEVISRSDVVSLIGNADLTMDF